MNRRLEKWSNPRIWVVCGIGFILLAAWLGLGIYLHVELARSRAKVEQNRLVAARQQELQRRGTQYKQELQQRNQAPRARNVFEGR